MKINRTWGSYGGEPCIDCKGPNDPYMLTNKLWNEVSKPGERRKLICLECVEIRLGRQLQAEDFHENKPPINYGVFGFHVEEFLETRSSYLHFFLSHDPIVIEKNGRNFVKFKSACGNSQSHLPTEMKKDQTITCPKCVAIQKETA